MSLVLSGFGFALFRRPRQDLYDNCIRIAVIRDLDCVVVRGRFECGYLTVEKIRVHELVMPRLQPSFEKLSWNLEQDESKGIRGHSGGQGCSIAFLKSGAGQYAALLRLMPVEQHAIESDQPRLTICIIERVTGWDTPYPHAFEWDYFPGPERVAKAMRRVMEG